MTDPIYAVGMGPPAPPPVYSRRLYYDDNGLPLFYSMEDFPYKYIEVDVETYSQEPRHVRVVDGKLKYLKTSVVLKLHPGDTGTPCHPNNVSIVVDPQKSHTRWTLR
jgi:hypothetical protein